MGSEFVLCDGATVCGSEHGFCGSVQGPGDLGCSDRVLDLSDHVAMDDQVSVEPFFGALPDEEVLGRGEPVVERRSVRRRGPVASASAVLLGQCCCLCGRCLQRGDARHRGRRSLHVGAIACVPGEIHRLAGRVLQPCETVATGGLVWLAGWLYEGFSTSGTASFDAYVRSWTVVLLLLCVTLVALGLYHLRALPSGGSASEGRSLRDGLSGLKEVIAAFFTKRHIWYYIAFIILYRLGEGFVMKIVPLFLKADTASGGLGLTNQQIGLYYGTFGAGAFLLGSLLAGYYIARRGLRRTLFTLCCIFNLPFGVYALLAWFQPSSLWLVGGGIVVEYFGYGSGFVGLTLFMMQQVAPGRHQMAHYAFASGIMNLSVMLTGMASGFLSDLMSYRIFFLAVMLATIPAFVITRLVPFTYDDKPNDK